MLGHSPDRTGFLGSDHCPLLLELSPVDAAGASGGGAAPAAAAAEPASSDAPAAAAAAAAAASSDAAADFEHISDEALLAAMPDRRA